MPEALKIASFDISTNNEVFVIAELSGNHNQSLDKALHLVKLAKESGASAVKLQTYTADTLTLDSKKDDFLIKDPSSLWNGKNLYELYAEAHTPWKWHKTIFDYCRELEILCFSSPFDESAVDFLEELNCPAYKIASFECTHIPLIKKAARTGKPIIVSTGMATEEEIDECVSAIKEQNNNKIILLKCTSTYPADPRNCNLKTIPELQKKFQCQVGLSDHTMGIGAAVAAVSLGATVIEKHFTDSRAAGGVDSAFSAEPKELQQLITETENARKALGSIKIGPTNDEKKSKQFRRSIYFNKDLKKGHVISASDIKIIRPGFGLEPKHYEEVLGKTLKEDVLFATPVKFEQLN